MDGKKGPPKLIDLESRAKTAYQAPAQSEKKETPVEKKETAVEKKETPAAETPARSGSLPAPTTTDAVEYPKDAPLKSAIEVPETTKSPTEFDPRNLEIKQDDPESDDEELTEAKKRAPVDDDDFEDEAKPSIVDVSGNEDKKKGETTKAESPAASSPAIAAVPGDKTPVTGQNSSDVSVVWTGLDRSCVHPLTTLFGAGQDHLRVARQAGRGGTSAPVCSAREQHFEVSIDQGQESGQAVGRFVEAKRRRSVASVSEVLLVCCVSVFVSCFVVDCIRKCFITGSHGLIFYFQGTTARTLACDRDVARRGRCCMLMTDECCRPDECRSGSRQRAQPASAAWIDCDPCRVVLHQSVWLLRPLWECCQSFAKPLARSRCPAPAQELGSHLPSPEWIRTICMIVTSAG